MIFVTGGAGFIGSNFIRTWATQAGAGEPVVNIDTMTYAGNPANLGGLPESVSTCTVDICDQDRIEHLLLRFQPRAVVHFAAESHVDRSISGPDEFIRTNVLGTFSLLKASLKYWHTLKGEEKSAFRFLHVSTDEVYGSLGPDDAAFTETHPYAPNSPYSASKASSDHLVRAYFHTYGLPVLTTNCSNNYGPFQFPEKLLPLMISNAIGGKNLPVYGDGLNIRDWLYVEDHCDALRVVLARGRVGETYNIGGEQEITNISLVKSLCNLLESLKPSVGRPYESLIEFVKDRLGHDRRYAVDTRKIKSELQWCPKENFESGFTKTIRWYLDNQDWVRDVLDGSYQLKPMPVRVIT